MALKPDEPGGSLTPTSGPREPEVLEVGGKLERPEIGRSLDIFREKLTSRLLVLFAVTVVGDLVLACVSALTGHDLSSARDVLRDVVPAETGLLGAAIGYYFGERAAR